MRVFVIGTLLVLPLMTGCILTEKRATVRITDESSHSEVCIKVEGRQSTETQSLPYTYTAEEGETVQLTAFNPTTSAVYANGSITTYMTNDCENEVTYYAKVYDGYINIIDDYSRVVDCKKDSN